MFFVVVDDEDLAVLCSTVQTQTPYLKAALNTPKNFVSSRRKSEITFKKK